MYLLYKTEPPTNTDSSVFIRICVVGTDIRKLCSIIRKSETLGAHAQKGYGTCDF